MVNGPIDESRVYRPTDENDEYAGVFGDNGAENVNKKEEKIMSFKMTQNQYTSLYGPTVGDSIRLGDTNLFAQIEKTMRFMVKKLLLVVVNLLETVWRKILV